MCCDYCEEHNIEYRAMLYFNVPKEIPKDRVADYIANGLSDGDWTWLGSDISVELVEETD